MNLSTERFLELLQDDDIQEQIKDLYCKLHKESFVESYDISSDWGWHIIMDADGELSHIYGGNKATMHVYDGDVISIATIYDNAEVDEYMLGDIEEVSDYKDFVSHLGNEFDFNLNEDLNDVEYEEKKEQYIKENATWENYREFNPDSYSEIEIEAWEDNSDICAYDEISDKLNCLIDDLQYQIEELGGYDYEL